LPNQHPRPWHRGSEFGDGLRFPLDREQRCVWRVRLDLARRAGRITSLHALVGEALLRRQGQDGRCDPCHATLAADVGCAVSTVQRALGALYELGMLRWINRLIRVGSRVEQTSNAYTLLVAAVAAFIPRPRGKNPCGTSGGQLGREIRSLINQNKEAAQHALAQVRLEFEKRWLKRAEVAKSVPR
jgi:AraC-like DNA-binding protein